MLRITAWNDHFENNRTRELKVLRWVPVPNTLDGDGYTDLIEHPRGAAHFGVWIILVEIASRCNPRGTLLRGCKTPHDYRSISRISRVPQKLVAEAVERLVQIGWLETVTEIPQEGATLGPQDNAVLPSLPSIPSLPSRGKEDARRKGDLVAAEEIYQLYPRHVGRQAALKAICKALEHRTHEWLVERTGAYAASWAGQQGRFTPYPSTWFTRASYDDDPQQWEKPQDTDVPEGHDVNWKQNWKKLAKPKPDRSKAS